MTSLRQPVIDTLIANRSRQAPVRGTPDEIDFVPVVRLYDPAGG